MNKPPEWQKASEAIQQADTILIVTHVNPDGDAIGSSLGLANALSQMGKTVTVAVDEGLPEFFAWLDNADQIVATLEAGHWDVMISTDASDEERSGEVGKYGRANSKTEINLDHHITNTYFGDIHLVDPHAVSATEIVYKWWQHMNIVWQPEIARPLLTGLVTDTLGFRTSHTTAESLGIAQQLINYGASLAEVTQRTLSVMSAKELLLWKQVLPTVEIHGEVAEASITKANLAKVGLEDFNTGGLVGLLRGVTEVMIAVIFSEEDDSAVKLSLRSKPGYDVAEVAFELGGGGHKQAAGATVAGSLNEVRARVLPLLQVAAEKGSLEIG